MALSSNPYNKNAFETQICAIVLAPTLVCISIYLTLKHLTSALNPALSRVRPRWYPLIFVPFDVSCLFVQAIGGAIAASAGSTNMTLLAAGNHAIIAGIALQVVVLLLFGTMSTDYYVRVRRWVRSGEATPEALALWRDRKFRMFGGAVLVAYVCVQIRCIYRYVFFFLFFCLLEYPIFLLIKRGGGRDLPWKILRLTQTVCSVAEMAGGWGNPIMQDQPSFTVLDSFMMLICVFALACFPPGILFPRMGKDGKPAKGEEGADVAEKEEGQNAEQSAGKSDEEGNGISAKLES